MRTQDQRAFILRLAFFVLVLLACDLSSLVGGVATKPTVVITAPASGARVNAGAEVAVQSIATDARGIAWIELWVDGIVVGNQTLPAPQTSYTVILPWRATTPGAHIVQVKAYNTAGAASEPAAIAIQVVPTVAQATPPSVPHVTPTPTSAQIPGAAPPPSPTSPVPTAPSPWRIPTNPTTAIRKPATPFAPADLPFHIDCSALDPSRKAECDLYIANTRDLVYPLLREITGTSLSSCYDAVYYKIVPDEQLTTHRAQAQQNRILSSLRETLNAAPAPLYDSHEILHTISMFCNNALDNHVFHGAIESHIDLTLTGLQWQNPGRELIANWLEKKLIPDIKKNPTPQPTPGVIAVDHPCAKIFGDLVTILYYDSGIEAIKRLYRATIKPDPSIVPNATLSTHFGAKAWQYQLVVHALKQNPKNSLRVPECGY
jgi:hypothetical protein